MGGIRLWISIPSLGLLLRLVLMLLPWVSKTIVTKMVVIARTWFTISLMATVILVERKMELDSMKVKK